MFGKRRARLVAHRISEVHDVSDRLTGKKGGKKSVNAHSNARRVPFGEFCRCNSPTLL